MANDRNPLHEREGMELRPEDVDGCDGQRLRGRAFIEGGGSVQLQDITFDVFSEGLSGDFVGTARMAFPITLGPSGFKWTDVPWTSLYGHGGREDSPYVRTVNTSREVREELGIERTEPHPEKQGYLRSLGNITPREFGDALDQFLERRGWAHRMEGYGMYTGLKYDGAPDEPIKPFRWVSVYAVTGGSEGYYIHVDLIRQNQGEGMVDVREMIYCCKVLGEGMDWCYRVCSEIAQFVGA